MAASKDERARILHLIEDGQVTAVQAAQLLDVLEIDSERPGENSRERIIRVRITGLKPGMQKVNVAATLPVSLIRTGLRLGTNSCPNSAMRRSKICYGSSIDARQVASLIYKTWIEANV